MQLFIWDGVIHFKLLPISITITVDIYNQLLER